MKSKVFCTKRLLYSFVSLILIFSFIPIQNISSSASEKLTSYVIWENDSDCMGNDAEGYLNAVLSSATKKYNVSKEFDNKGSFFSIDYSISGKGGEIENAVLDSSINSYTEGFGWMGNDSLLSKIAPYLSIKFEYRINSSDAIPSDAKLSLCAAYPTKASICKFAEVSAYGAGEWTSVSMPLSGSSFALPWLQGYINVYLTTSEGEFKGTQTVDLRHISLTVNETDRKTLNSKLTANKYTKIDNFSKDKELTLDDAGNKDYFELLATNDSSFYNSVSTDKNYHNIYLKDNGGSDVILSSLRAEKGEKVTVYTELPKRKMIKEIKVNDEAGNKVDVTKGVENKRYTFILPDKDVYISVSLDEMAGPDAVLLWYCDPGSENINPYYVGTDSRPYSWGNAQGPDSSAWKFNVLKSAGGMTLYGRVNKSYKIGEFYDTAYVTMMLKLETETDNHEVKIAGTKETPVKSVRVGTDWTQIQIPFKEISNNQDIDFLTFGMDNLAVGDMLYIGEVCIWNKEMKNIREGFDSVLDISGYTKSDTNTLLGVIGDTNASIDPWNETQSTYSPYLQWDRAWYYSFQNQSPWILNVMEQRLGNPYCITFYIDNSSLFDSPDGYLNCSDYIDTGYVEFFMKSDTDKTIIPLSIQSQASKRVFIPLYVMYEKSKARPDGYMRVRVPFRYLNDMGIDIEHILLISVKGTMAVKDNVLLSSFRFYSNYADVAEPETIEEEKPKPERSLPIELNRNLINAVLDKKAKILYVPENTAIWEILASIKLDTDESYVDFYYNDSFIDDEFTVLNDEMSMLIYRRGFYLDTFKIEYLTNEYHSVISTLEDGDTVSPKTGEDRTPLIILSSSVILSIILIFKMKKTFLLEGKSR